MQKISSSVFPFAMIILVLVLFIQSCGTSTNNQQNVGISGSIAVDSVYTTDASQKDKTVFGRGDLINYDVKINNTMSSQSSIAIHVQISATNYNHFVASHLYTYDHTDHINTVQPGLSNFQTSTSIPSDAAPATYGIQITVTPENTAFSPSSGKNSFTIQPPSQLGPFDTGTFTRDNGHVQGSAQLTIFQNGNYKFNGCIQNLSSGLGYSDALSWGVASASGVLYKFDHTGGISGKWQIADPNHHQDCWNITGTDQAIAKDWIPLSFQANHWEGDVSGTVNNVTNSVANFFKSVSNSVVNYFKENGTEIGNQIIEIMSEAGEGEGGD